MSIVIGNSSAFNFQENIQRLQIHLYRYVILLFFKKMGSKMFARTDKLLSLCSLHCYIYFHSLSPSVNTSSSSAVLLYRIDFMSIIVSSRVIRYGSEEMLLWPHHLHLCKHQNITNISILLWKNLFWHIHQIGVG